MGADYEIAVSLEATIETCSVLHAGDQQLKQIGATLRYLYQHRVRTTLAHWARVPDAIDTFPSSTTLERP